MYEKGEKIVRIGIDCDCVLRDFIPDLVEKIKEANHNLLDRKICKDNKDEIVLILKDWLKSEKIDVIITTGGTGLTGRDITPEALDEIADKHIQGFGSPKILINDNMKQPEIECEFNFEESPVLCDKEYIYQHADIISIHTPLTLDTRDMIKKDQLLTMKKDEIIIVGTQTKACSQ